MKKPKSSKHDGISAWKSMGEKQPESLQVCKRTPLGLRNSHVILHLSSRLPLLTTQGSLVFREVLMVTSHRVDEYQCRRCKSTEA